MLSKYLAVGDYDYRKFPWFPPYVVIRAMNRLSKICDPFHIESKREFRMAREMFEAAIALLGSYEIDPSNKYYLQGNFQTPSPDVLAGKQIETENEPIMLGITQLEMVTMTEHTETNDLVDFLKKTKLSSKKDYDSHTLIVCTVKKKIKENAQNISERIRVLNPKSTIYIVGKLVNEHNKWMIFSPFPILTPVKIYSLSEAIEKSNLPKASIVFGRNLDKKISYEKVKDETTSIWEIFGIKEAEIEKYKLN